MSDEDCPDMPPTLAEIREIQAENKRLREALERIQYGEGAYSPDQLTHAANCIDDMKSIAGTALKDTNK